MNSNEVLHLDFEITEASLRRIFFDDIRDKFLPMIQGAIAFTLFGIFFIVALGDYYLLFIVGGIYILSFGTLAFTYLNFIKNARKMFAKMNDAQKNIHFIIQENSDGIEIISGKDFSHLAWDSIHKIAEKENSFILELLSGKFPIPKSSFNSENEVVFFKNLCNLKLPGQTEFWEPRKIKS